MKSFIKSIGIVLFMLIITFLLLHYQEKKNEKFDYLPTQYAIGIVDKINYPPSGGPIITYSYKINSSVYKNKKSVTLGSISTINKGDMYLVKFLESDITESRLLLDYEIDQDKLANKNLSKFGFDEIPIDIIMEYH